MAEAIAIFDRVLVEDSPSFSIFDFSKVRAYLQYAIVTQNACRTGIIIYFDHDIYDARIHNKNRNKVVFSMAKHKTSGSLGSADTASVMTDILEYFGKKVWNAARSM